NSEDIQKENNELLLSKFNKLIYKEIANQPTPYLYEKLGVKFNDYLIDEFQDTSNLQWKNLIPLISHALESFQENENQGSLFLVGDPKQSVYRWRGADPKIFVSLLLNKKTPFSVQKNITNLPVNFRSRNEIIKFNNSLFKHASGLLNTNYHKKIFLQGSNQKQNNFSNGHVSITFINKDFKKEQQLASVLKETLSQIENCLSRGFKQSEIAVLVRDNKQSSQVSEWLIENNVSVLSQDSLSINNSKKIELLINLIKLKVDNNNQEARAILIGKFATLVQPKDLFVFYKENLKNEFKRFLKNLNIFSLYMAFEMSFLESVDFFIKELNMDLSNTDPYILFLREVIFEQVSQNKNNEKEFLIFWKKNNKKIKIPSSSSKNAVQVLTIHKAKGLEFPVVIYPFVDSVTHRNSGKRNWLPVFEENLSKKILIPFNENFREYSDSFQKEYDNISSNEELDNLNLLYVALTRSVDELHLISEYPKTKTINSHNQIIRAFLEGSGEWKDDLDKFNWGKPVHKEKTKKTERTPCFKGYETRFFQPIPDTKFLNEKIVFGNVFHEFMSKIEFETDYIKEKNELMLSKSVDKSIKNKVIKLSKSVIDHPDLKEYFSKNNLVYCEQEIFTESNKIIKPDRLVFLDSNRVVVIDYKTGEKSTKDQKQIVKYQKTLKKMGYKLEASLLIYLENSIDIVKVK
ncbi:MAG: UvrD-helicase domain-containing protein, partial [Flavobacteriaceae bacterium]|nr:UvrD-helicase domain-containing protein [Flavobacteriaceae bacterium]